MKAAAVSFADCLVTAPRAVDVHGHFYVRQLANALSCIQRVFHQLPDGCIETFSRLRAERGSVSVRLVCVPFGLDRRALTLSKPAMFLFSAKNSAGLFCCSTSALPIFFPINNGC